jgi:ABC-2 type transport system permease protein
MMQMNGNLFIKEMKRNTFSLAIWMVVITILITITMSVYNIFLENQSKVMGMMSLIPKGALQFKGVSNFNDLFSVLGFYAVNNIIYMMVLGSIFAIVLSSNILLKEEYNKTAEYLLSWPLSRREIFLTKLAAYSLNVFLLNLVTALAGFICIELVKKGPLNFSSFLILSLYTFLLNMLFGAVGLFLSVMIKRPRPITTLCIGLVLIMYFIYTLSKITESISEIGYLSPFKYVNMEVSNPAYRIEFLNLAYFVVLSLLLIMSSYRLYLRRDIYT